MANPIALVILGFIGFVVGIALLPVVFSSTAAALSAPAAESFATAVTVGELLPLVGIAAVMIVGIGLMAVGGTRAVRGR
jgi:hypothetical protein